MTGIDAETGTEIRWILDEGFAELEGRQPKPNIIKGIAKRLVREYHSQYSPDTLAENVERFITYAQPHRKEMDYSGMLRIMRKLVQPVVGESLQLGKSTES